MDHTVEGGRVAPCTGTGLRCRLRRGAERKRSPLSHERNNELSMSTGRHGRAMEFSYHGKHERGEIPVAHADRL